MYSLSSHKDIYIPKVFKENSTSRILITEWIDGVKINDTESLKKMNVSNSEIIKSLTEAMGHQIFTSGFVHADPHLGFFFI